MTLFSDRHNMYISIYFPIGALANKMYVIHFYFILGEYVIHFLLENPKENPHGSELD